MYIYFFNIKEQFYLLEMLCEIFPCHVKLEIELKSQK